MPMAAQAIFQRQTEMIKIWFFIGLVIYGIGIGHDRKDGFWMAFFRPLIIGAGAWLIVDQLISVK